MESWKRTQLEYLEYFYKKAAEAWVELHDDRRLFSNTYYMLHEAFESLDDNPHVCVCVAMNRYTNEEYEMMNEIKHRFEEMGLGIE